MVDSSAVDMSVEEDDSTLETAPLPTPKATGDQRLKALVEKLESLESEKSEIQNLMRDAFMEAKLAGYDPKVLRQVLKCRKLKRDEYLEQEMLLSTYLSAIGMKVA